MCVYKYVNKFHETLLIEKCYFITVDLEEFDKYIFKFESRMHYCYLIVHIIVNNASKY